MQEDRFTSLPAAPRPARPISPLLLCYGLALLVAAVAGLLSGLLR